MDAFSGAGAARDNTKYAPLTMDRYITGLVTQRSPLRDAMVPYLQAKFNQAGRFDSLWDGLNVELNAKSNLSRRPGNSIYNSAAFPPVNRFAKHNIVVDGVSSIHVIADTATTVWDATGPSTKFPLWVKSAGAGSTYFQSVGNTLYFSNGVDRKKWTIPTHAWKPSTSFPAGTVILDTNNNLQEAVGGYTVSIPSTPPAGGVVNIQHNILTIALDPNDPNLPDFDYAAGTQLTLSGFNISTFLNGQTITLLKYVGTFPNPNIITANFVHASYSGFDTTGAATSGNGITGGTMPVWPTGIGTGVVDGGAQWLARGSSITDWGTDGPTIAPTVNQAVLTSSFESWKPTTYYSAIPYILPVDGGGGITIQRLTTAGTTAGTVPTYSTTAGAVTANGSANYTCVAHVTPYLNPGDGNWAASTAYALNAVVATILPGAGRCLMLCVQAGTSGIAQPTWNATYGNLKTDNTVVWQNYGGYPLDAPVSTAVSTAGAILDENGFIETVTLRPSVGAWGVSDATEPTWPMAVGTVTIDNPGGSLPLYWLNSSEFSPAFTDPVTYWYSFRSHITSTESNLPPVSLPIIKLANDQIQVQGFGSGDPQCDTVRLYRTAQGGSTPLFVADLPMPPGGTAGIWTYDDTSVDADLNIEIQGAQNDINDRPPVGLQALTYHVGRVWGAVDNLVYFDTGPDEGATSGAPDEAWSPGNVFAFPDPVKRLVPVTINNGGLLVFTTSDLYVILGTGTASNPFFSTLYGAGIGLLSYDALDIIGATIHLQTTARKQISLDPSAGYVETGQPIGDQFKKVTTGGISTALYSPATTFCTWHEAESGDTGLIVADGAVGWFRYSPISSPETGFLWSPRAAIEGGTSAVQSVETSPGIKQLLIGPHTTGPILARDTSVHSDNGTPYADTYAVVGSIQLCQPYEIAEVAGVVLDSIKVGTAPTIGMLFGEIDETAGVPFTMYEKSSNDPPLLPASVTLNGDRFVMSQKGKCPKHRHVQLLIQLAVEDQPNEILTHTIFGSISIERKAIGANP